VMSATRPVRLNGFGGDSGVIAWRGGDKPS